MDVWREKIQQDIVDLKDTQSEMGVVLQSAVEDISELKLNDKLQDKELESFKSTLDEIKDDTKWIRRTITSAFIVAIIGGLVGVFISTLF